MLTVNGMCRSWCYSPESVHFVKVADLGLEDVHALVLFPGVPEEAGDYLSCRGLRFDLVAESSLHDVAVDPELLLV